MSAGGFLLMAPWLFARKSPASLDTGIQVIAAICILFGLMRIGNSIYHIRRLSRL